MGNTALRRTEDWRARGFFDWHRVYYTFDDWLETIIRVHRLMSEKWGRSEG